MATKRRRRESGINILRGTDIYGRISMAGSAPLITERQLRKITTGKNRLVHRAKNGINDPYTFFHLVEALLGVAPFQPFTAAQLVRYLNAERPSMTWDAVTVGRVLNDIRDNLVEANPNEQFQPISMLRDWSGVYYETVDYAPARAVLFRLINDLLAVCAEVQEAEASGEIARRTQSPLLACPSIMDVARAVAENAEDAA
jgi:hypothetical protein